MSQTKSSFRLSLLALALLALPVMARAQADPQNNALATQIDNYLNGIHPKNDLRPLSGHGTNFASEGSTYNVDPRFVVAISGAETTFGAFTCSEDNAFNWFWNPGTGCHQSPFDNWDAGIHTVSHYLQKSYLLKGYTSIPLIGGRYCASGCEHWVPNVTSIYQTLGGDPNGALTFPTAVTGTTASANPTPQEMAAPAVSATLTADTSAATTNKGPAFIVEATFSSLTNQRLSGVELYRDVPPKPTHVVSLLRVTGSPDTAPVYRASFTLPANDTGADLRVRGQLSLHGKSLGAITSDPLTLPSPSSHLWLIVGIIAGALVLVIGVVLLIVMLRKRKSGSAPVKPAATAEAKPTATVTEIRPATTESKSADKTGTATK